MLDSRSTLALPLDLERNLGRATPSGSYQDFARIPVHPLATPTVQAKFVVNTPGDAYEQEADRVSEQVVRMLPSTASLPITAGGAQVAIRRKCSCGATCDKCSLAGQFKPDFNDARLQRKSTANLAGLRVPPGVHQVLASPGQPLDMATRAFMEPRFHRDFGHVRVHSGPGAEASSQSISALAYTAGNHIVFGHGQYRPHTASGVKLLAHELVHVAQQETSSATNRIFRFADNTHNVIDEVAVSAAVEEIAEALAAANDFEAKPGDNERAVRDRDKALGEKKKSHLALEQIHEGNTERDYSQSPRAVNFLLRCEPAKYGGYDANDHFDNFEWNKELEKWQTRSNPVPSGLKRTSEPQNPITHIRTEFLNFVNESPRMDAFRHVGSAFHAIEDFFAHSNFIELTHGDHRFGDELLTGSVPSGDTVSLLKIAESISNRDTAPIYGAAAQKKIEAADRLSHPRIAKDYNSNVYQMEAIVLAALVIKVLAKDVFALGSIRTRDEQRKYVDDIIMPMVIRYLRPPNRKDKWWEALLAQGGATMEKKIRQTAANTPVTINQCAWSPMRSIEAAKDVNMKLFGLTFEPARANIFIQVGSGVAVQPEVNDQYGNVQTREVKGIKFGVSVSGSF